MGIRRISKNCASLFGLAVIAFFISGSSGFAGSGQWNNAPTSGDWNTANNWTPVTVPNGASDTATFVTSAQAAVSLSATTKVSGITFNSGASAFTITASPSDTLTISGIGIVNNSGITQNFATVVDGSGNSGTIILTNSATAGAMTVFTNNGAIVYGSLGGSLQFAASSIAGSARITNNGIAFSRGGSFTEFSNTSSADNAVITNNGATGVFAQGGGTQFYDSATAGSATIANNGTAFNGGQGGFTGFANNSTAGSARITNNASMVPGGSPITRFDNSATAGGATITNNGATVSRASGGFTEFLLSSTAGSATITNNGAAATGQFASGSTNFNDSSTAGSAAITNNGASVSGARGGGLFFNNASTADNATITNNGSAFSGGGSITDFFNSATAHNATLIANSGTGAGGSIFFFSDSTGGTARVEVFGIGQLDISVHNSPGVTIGSIEGDGNVFLGARNLTVGNNNLDTSFSGVLQDGGQNGGTGGSLTKIGTGTFTLSAVNAYTGGTTINAGVLQVDNASGSGTGLGAVSVNDGGTLSGKGFVAGAVTVNGGGVISPGNSPGTFTTSSTLTLNSNATYRFELNSSTAVADKIVANGVTINGANFSFSDLGTGKLSLGTTFTIIDNTSSLPINGVFGNLADHSIFTNNGNTYLVSYEGGTGNDLTLTSITVVVPEPTTFASFILGATLLLVVTRKRRV